MANKKLTDSSVPQVASPSNDMTFYVAQGGVTKKLTWQQLVAAVGGAPAVDTTPDGFTFFAMGNVALGSQQTSNTITVSGLSSGTSAAVSVSGGTYSKNGGAYTSAAGTAQNGDTFNVRHTASGANGTSTTTTLVIGGVFGNFTSTTTASGGVDSTPDSFTFADSPNIATSTVITSNTITVSGLDSGVSVAVSVTGGTYSKNGGAFTGSAGTAQNGDTFSVRHTSSADAGTAVNTTLNIGGVVDTFTSTTVAANSTITAPAGFGTVPFGATFQKNGSVYSTVFTGESYRLTDSTPGVAIRYVDYATGNDSNPGTAAQPWKNLFKVSQMDRTLYPKVLCRAKGTFPYGAGFGDNATQALELTLESWDGNPVIVDRRVTGTWTADTGNTYWLNLAGFGYTNYGSSAWDGKYPTPEGDYGVIKPAADLAACRATPGTFYLDTAASRIYVHCQDNRVPDADIYVYDAWGGGLPIADYPAAPANQTVFVDNYVFNGGINPVSLIQSSSTYVTTVIMKKCVMKYAGGTSNAVLNAYGNLEISMYECVGACGYGDVFSYGSYGGSPSPRVFEINCIVRYAGIDGNASISNQGSTTHDGSRVVRMGTKSYKNQNDQLADVNSNSKSWILGGEYGPKGENGYAAIRMGNGTGSPTCWIDGAKLVGTDIGLIADTGVTIYTRNVTTTGIPTPISGAGTVTGY